MSELELLNFRQRTFAQLRRASDDVRNSLIPAFDANVQSFRDAYFRINSRYFDEDVLAGQMMLRDDVAQYTAKQLDDPYYVTSLDDLRELRTGRGNAGGFEVLHPRFIGVIAERCFSIFDKASSFDSNNQRLKFLAIADFLFQVSHFSKDGSGRSGEDALVLLGRLNNLPLTFSLTGYRAALGGPAHLMLFRHLTERMGQLELARNFFRWLGIEPPENTPLHIQELLKSLLALSKAPRTSRANWPQGTGEIIDDILEPLALTDTEKESEFSANHPYRLYATFIAKEAAYLTLCLEDPSNLHETLYARYPLSMACRELDIHEASKQTYFTVPDDVSEVADDAVSRLDLKRNSLTSNLGEGFDEHVSFIKTKAPVLGNLLETEKQTASLEVLLTRVKVSLKESMTAADVREAVSHQLDWKI